MQYMLWLNATVPICPRIVRTLPDGYVMERLVDNSVAVLHNVDHHLMRVRRLLAGVIWHRRPFSEQHRLWYDKIVSYCIDVLEEHGFPEEGIKDFLRIWNLQTYHTEECAIHGDPTLDNVLVRPVSAPARDPLVLTDPLPPDDRIPNDRAVDLGKLLQSALGWESVRRGKGWPTDTRHRVKVVLDGEDYKTACRSWFWCLIHFIRILPYARGDEMTYPCVRQMVHKLLKERPDGVRPAPSFGF